jgi:hypothetical protein
MKRIITLFAILLLAALPLLADTPKKEDDAGIDNRAFKGKIFDVHNRNPHDLADAIRLLGSGFKGATLVVSTELHTITVRDFPENIAVMEEALKRLDHAVSTPDITLNIAVLIGSKTPLAGAGAVPDDLAPVVKQLQSALRYSNYGLLTSTMHRTKPGSGIDNSGVAEPALVGMTAHEGQPIFYSYAFSQISLGEQSINVEKFIFSMRVPVEVGNGGVQYQNVGFNTPVSIRQNEKVVIGTTTMGDKALIVVVTASVEK